MTWRPPAWGIVTAAATAVILVAAVRGIAGGYEPTSDIAVVEIRAREVFTGDNPLFGMWSSGSLRAGLDFNHPGPLQFVVWALPVRLLGSGAGLATAAAAVNIGAVWSIALTARRIGGDRTALVAAAVTVILAWNMGSEVLYDAWPPNAVVLAFLAMLLAVWAAVLGHAWLLLAAVVAGSLAPQSHHSYLFLVPGLVAVGAAGAVVAFRRRGERIPPAPFVVSGVVAVVLWAPPVWEQLFGRGVGNLSRLVESSAGGDGRRVGLPLGLRLFGSVVAVPTAWFPSGYDTAVPTQPLVDVGGSLVLPSDGVATMAVVLASLTVAAGALGWCAWDARRRPRPTTTAGLVVVATAFALAFLTVIILPVDDLGLTPHKLRFLWPVAALSWIVVGDHVGAILGGRSAAWTRPAVAAVAVFVAVLAVPTAPPTTGPVALRDAWPAVRDLRDQMSALDDAGTVLFDPGGLYYLEPYTWPLMAELEALGIPYVLEWSSSQRQVGDSHRFRGTADVRVFVRVGEEARRTPPGATRIAFVDDPRTGPAAVYAEPFAPSG